MRCVTTAAALLMLATACGGDEYTYGYFPPVDGGPLDSGTGGNQGTGGALPGTGGAMASNAPISVPDVPIRYSVPDDPGAEVLAFTLHEAILGPEWLIAIRNTSSQTLCSFTLRTTFLDAAGTPLAETNESMSKKLHRGCNGACDLIACMGPGQTAMQAASLGLSDLVIGDVAEIVWSIERAFIVADAVPTADALVTGVEVVQDNLGRNQFAGLFVNNGPNTMTFPKVEIFGTDGAGRPITQATAIEDTSVPPGGTWAFTTGGFSADVMVDGFAIFPDANE